MIKKALVSPRCSITRNNMIKWCIFFCHTLIFFSALSLLACELHIIVLLSKIEYEKNNSKFVQECQRINVAKIEQQLTLGGIWTFWCWSDESGSIGAQRERKNLVIAHYEISEKTHTIKEY